MSKTLLYRMWGIRGYEYTRTIYEAAGVCFGIEQEPATLRCACCGSYRVEKSGVVVRRFRTVPVGGKAVSIELPIQRLHCTECGKTRQAEVGFADARRGYTRSFERYVLDLSRHMTIKAVAGHLGVGWDTVKDIQKRNLGRRFRKPRLKHLRRIAIDEISIGKGRQYLTRGSGPGRRGGGVRGERQGFRGPGPVLEAAAGLGGEGQGGGDGHEPRLHRGGEEEPAQGDARVRPLPRGQAVQREARPVPPGRAAGRRDGARRRRC